MFSVRMYSCLRRSVSGCLVAAPLAFPTLALAQQRLSLQEAVDEALTSRPVLKADAARVAAAEGAQRQAAAHPTGEFQFSNENLRRGQIYTRDVDTLAILTVPLDLAGRRGARTGVADQHVAVVTSESAASRVQVVRAVTAAYWEAREAQEARDVLKAAVDAFQQVVDYHAAQFRVGVIPEQDLLRTQLESERLKVTAGLAALDASRTRSALLKAIGRRRIEDVELTDPLDGVGPAVSPLSDEAVLTARKDVATATAALAEATANIQLQTTLGRPEFYGVFGYKRTQLPDAPTGVNTLVAGVRISVPWGDRNEGNRLAATAEVRRQQALLDAARTEALADYHAAFDDYTSRRRQIADVVIPLRRDAANLAQLAQAAYDQGGMDLLRLLDAKKARLDADLAWVHAMADWQVSAADLKFAGGEIK
jgi:cobalt-zinc-cadmium efflux system outer membrane protein